AAMHLVPKGVCRAVLLVQRGLQPCDSGVLGGQCLLDGGYNRVRALCHPDPRIEVVVSMRAKFDALGAKHLVQPLDHGRGHAPSAGCGGSVPVWRNASPNAKYACQTISMRRAHRDSSPRSRASHAALAQRSASSAATVAFSNCSRMGVMARPSRLTRRV